VSSDKTLAKKVVIVTGAASMRGLGRAMTHALLDAGARVAMLDHDEATLGQAYDEVKEIFDDPDAHPWVLDVTDPAAVADVVGEIVAKLGGVDVLVNNAGIGIGAGVPRGPFWELPVEAFQRIVSVNYLGAVYMARACVPRMLEQGSGSIIGVTTSLDTMLLGSTTAYGAPKAAHEAFIASAASALDNTGVRVNVLVPGGMADTNLIGSEFTGDRSTLIRPEVMKAPVVWLASDAAKDVTGLRFIASLWDESLPVEERIRRAGAPAAWKPLGRRSTWSGVAE
jgi:3-oxoacyl-[acyl-carrier protein] reductase